MSRSDSNVPRETKREVLHAGDDGIAVVWPQSAHPGVVAIGRLKRGVEYVVAPAEAVRLHTAKGFAYATPADARRAEAHAASGSKHAAAAVEPAAATADVGGGGIPVNQVNEE